MNSIAWRCKRVLNQAVWVTPYCYLRVQLNETTLLFKIPTAILAVTSKIAFNMSNRQLFYQYRSLGWYNVLNRKQSRCRRQVTEACLSSPVKCDTANQFRHGFLSVRCPSLWRFSVQVGGISDHRSFFVLLNGFSSPTQIHAVIIGIIIKNLFLNIDVSVESASSGPNQCCFFLLPYLFIWYLTLCSSAYYLSDGIQYYGVYP